MIEWVKMNNSIVDTSLNMDAEGMLMKPECLLDLHCMNPVSRDFPIFVSYSRFLENQVYAYFRTICRNLITESSGFSTA